jgi:tetratricopeptide (TPR) repeat protein
MWAGDTTTAAQMALTDRRRFPRYENAAVSFSNVLIHARMYKEAEQICRDFLSTGEESPQILLNIGLIKEIQNQYDSSVYYYDLAYKVWPDAPMDMQLNLYMKCIINGYDSLASAGLERILPRLRTGNRKFTAGVLNVLKNGRPAAIDSLRKVLLGSVQSGGAG